MHFGRYIIAAALLAAPLTTWSVAADSSRSIIFDLPVSEQLGRVRPSALSREDSLAIMSYRFVGDTFKVLVIPVEWSDRPATWPRTTLDSMIFSRNVYSGGSVADYFHEVSYGRIVLDGDVIDWYNAGLYTNSFSFGTVLAPLDSIIDFSQYDGDQDTLVDAVVFVRSGNGQEDTHDPNDIWSYASVGQKGTGPGPWDGMWVTSYNRLHRNGWILHLS